MKYNPTPGVVYKTAREAHAEAMLWTTTNSVEFQLVYASMDRFIREKKSGNANFEFKLRNAGEFTTFN